MARLELADWLRKRWYWVIVGVSLLVSILFLSQEQFAKTLTLTPRCFDPPGTLGWPVPVADGLGNGYLQPEIEVGQMFPHLGIDVMAAVDTPVLAIEDGKVVKREGTEPYHYLVVESATQPGRGILYLHVKDTSDGAGLYETVVAGQTIAAVDSFTPGPAPLYDHLHVEFVRGYDSNNQLITSAGQDWKSYESYDSPLRGLTPPADSASPEILLPTAGSYLPTGHGCDADPGSPQDWPFWFRDDAGPTDPADYHCPDDLPFDSPLDIICRVADQHAPGAGLVVSPCCGTLRIRSLSSGNLEVERPVRFEGQPPESALFESFLYDDALPSGGLFSGARTLYLIVTNDAGASGSWSPQEHSDYEITVEIRDAAGNSASRSAIVNVP